MWWTARSSSVDPQSVSARRGLDRAIWRLGLPAFGALVAHPVFLLIDAAIVGTLGTAPLAGLGAATTVISAVVGLCVFLAYATTSSVARLLGANDRAGALAQGLAGMLLGLGLGVVLGIAVWWSAPLLASGLGTTGEVTDFSVTYLRIIAISLPAMLGVLAGVGVLRGLQDTKTTLVVTLSQVGVNLVLSLVLVLGLGWGIAGSAVGTAVAEFVGLFAYGAVLILLVRRDGVPVVPTMAGIVRAARDGVPLFIRTIALRIVFLVAAAAAARLGSPELAAYHVTATLFFALALALDALAIAGQALLGKVLGASDAHSARLITRRLLYWSVWLGLALAVFVLAIRPWLPGWFSNDEAVIAIMSSALIIVAVQQPLAGAVFALDGILIGAGDTRFLAWAQIAVLGGFIPAAWWVVQSGWGVDGLWWAIAWFLLLRLIILGWRAHGSAWIVTGAVRQR
ncbi:MAG: MATE family efflux transporter [Actinomycetes bacterium]